MKKNLLLFLVGFTALTLSAQSYTPETFRKWGDECYAATEKFLRVPGVYSYEETIRGHLSRATCWPLGVQLKGLIWGGYIEQAELTYAYFHYNYFRNANGIDGYDAVYRNPHADRYYDDNAWIAKLLMDLYLATDKDPLYLERAKMVVKFCMSGESVVGGIHWHESESDPSSDLYYTWSIIGTAPTFVANLKIYQATGEEQYLTDGKRLYDFAKSEGWGIGGGYRGYENAVIMQGALLLYEITGEKSYLDDVYQLAYSMESIYISWSDHVLHEVGKWGGHDMADAYIDLYNFDKNPHWLGIIAGYLAHIYNYCKDENGFYPEGWDDYSWKNEPMENGKRIYGLIENASAMSAFYRLASTPVEGINEKEPVAIFKHKAYNRQIDGEWNEDGIEVGIEGWSIGLTPGKYTSDDLFKRGMCTNRFVFEKELSSMIIADGYRVTLYSKGDFTGSSKTFTASTPYVGAAWDNRAMSIIVEKEGGQGSIADESSNLSPYVYPTIFSDEINIKNLTETVSVTLSDLSAKKWVSTPVSTSEISIPGGFLPSGAYILKIMGQNNTYVSKLMKR